MKHLIKILPHITIQFARIHLMPMDKNDVAYQQLLASEEILDFVHTIPSHSDVFYSQFKLDDYGLDTQSSDLIFLIKQKQITLGFCIVHHISRQSAEFSFYIAKAYRKQKIVLEAFIAMSGFCYSQLGLKYAQLGTFDAKILQYLQRLDLFFDQQNKQRKTRLFSNDVTIYFSARLHFESFKYSIILKRLFPNITHHFQATQHQTKKVEAQDLFQKQPIKIENPHIRAFFEHLTSVEK